MDGILNENQLNIVKEYEFPKPRIHKMDSIFDNCIGGFHNEYFHKFKYRCLYDFNFTKIANIEKINTTISDKGMTLYRSNKKVKFA